METRVKYKASDFNAEEASTGALCIMVKIPTASRGPSKAPSRGDDSEEDTTEGGDTPIVDPSASEEPVTPDPSDAEDQDVAQDIPEAQVENVEEMALENDEFPTVYVKSVDSAGRATWAENEYFKGAGICRVQNNNYYFTVNSITYVFNSKGKPVSSNAVGWVLKRAEPMVSNTATGSAISSSISSVETRSGSGSGTATGNSGSTVIVDSLNPRDQFAMQALRGMLGSIKDPSVLSSNEINFYCTMAYKWASGMMTSAADARATVNQSASATTKQNVGTLENNTEKLLNNLIVELEKTNVTEQQGSSQVTSERVSIPALISFLNSYVAHTPGEGETKTTVGLDDLIEAIKGISTGGGGGGGTSGSTQVTSMPALTGSIDIGSTGLGRDTQHPLFISSIFPTRSSLTNIFYSQSSDSNLVMNDILTFNSAGASGYSTIQEVGKAIIARLENTDKSNLYNVLKSYIDTRIEAWIASSLDSTGGSLVPDNPDNN